MMKIVVGIMATTPAADSPPQFTARYPTNSLAMNTGSVLMLKLVRVRANNSSFQEKRNARMAVAVLDLPPESPVASRSR